MNHAPADRNRRFGAAAFSAVALVALMTSLGGCGSSEKTADDGAGVAPARDNSLSPQDQQIRDVQRERASQRSYAK